MIHSVIIAAALNGARRGKADHAALPITPDEIGREAARCRHAGAAMVHVHVRDGAGRHSLDPGLYRAALAAIRREVGADLIVQATTEAVGVYAPDQQMAAMRDLQPEALSVAVRELFAAESWQEPAAEFLHEQSARGALVQHILYDADDVARFRSLVEGDHIPRKGASALFVLGRYTAGQQSDPSDLLPFLAEWDLDMPWAVCAFGRREAACAVTAANLGGHVRVGFENNLHLPDGRIAPDNAALVRVVAESARALGLRVATPDEARAVFAR